MFADSGVTFAAGVVFGLALAAPPGPMNAVIAEESVLRGWTAGLRAGLGAMTADVVFFLLALAGLVTVVERAPVVQALMVTVGGALMLYFALDAARSARTSLTRDESENGTGSAGFRKALVLGLSNPYQVLFWLTVGVGLLTPGRIDVLEPLPVGGERASGLLVVETGSAVLVAGLFAGVICWILLFPAALVATRRRVDVVGPVVAGLSAVVLALFGGWFLYDGLSVLL